jgi:hypothetical protein
MIKVKCIIVREGIAVHRLTVKVPKFELGECKDALAEEILGIEYGHIWQGSKKSHIFDGRCTLPDYRSTRPVLVMFVKQSYVSK